MSREGTGEGRENEGESPTAWAGASGQAQTLDTGIQPGPIPTGLLRKDQW